MGPDQCQANLQGVAESQGTLSHGTSGHNVPYSAFVACTHSRIASEVPSTRPCTTFLHHEQKQLGLSHFKYSQMEPKAGKGKQKGHMSATILTHTDDFIERLLGGSPPHPLLEYTYQTVVLS